MSYGFSRENAAGCLSLMSTRKAFAIEAFLTAKAVTRTGERDFRALMIYNLKREYLDRPNSARDRNGL